MKAAHLLILLVLIAVPILYYYSAEGTSNKIEECEALKDRISKRFYKWDPYYHKNKCYQDYAIKARKPTLCLQINHPDTKARCIAMVTGDQTVCEQIQDPKRSEQCLADATLLYKNNQGCSIVSKGTTLDTCYWDQAKIQGKTELCFKIENPMTQEWCLMSTSQR